MQMLLSKIGSFCFHIYEGFVEVKFIFNNFLYNLYDALQTVVLLQQQYKTTRRWLCPSPTQSVNLAREKKTQHASVKCFYGVSE